MQGPVADDSAYDLLGLYALWSELYADRVEIFIGGRFTYAAARAGRFLNPETGEVESLSDSWTNFSGSGRVMWRALDSLHLYASVAQGFRAPNLSDLTRLDSARSNEIQTPSTDLSPETFLGLEIGTKSRGRRHRASLAVFGTFIYDGLVRTPTGRTIDGEEEVRVRNVGNGFVTGVEFGGAYTIWRELELFGNASYVFGKQDIFPSSEPVKVREYIDRMPPFAGQAGLRWAQPGSRLWGEIGTRFALEQSRVNSRDRSDTQRIPPGGTPAWATLDIRAGIEVARFLRFALALENLTDETYRVHGSGVTAAGRQVKLTTELSF